MIGTLQIGVDDMPTQYSLAGKTTVENRAQNRTLRETFSEGD